MKYGQGFWCILPDGTRSKTRVYPQTRGMEYNDGTGERAEWLTEDFVVDYVPPGWTTAIRMTFRKGFDFDWASIPTRFGRFVACDKADYRIRAASLGHDMGFCVHEVWPCMTLSFWNTFLEEVMEAYSGDDPGVILPKKSLWQKTKDAAQVSADWALRKKVRLAVATGGPFCWKKSEADIEKYRKLFDARGVAI